MIVTLRKKGVPSLPLILVLFVYAFFGHYASYSISLWKDSLFGAGITALSLLLWTEPEEGEAPKTFLKLQMGSRSWLLTGSSMTLRGSAKGLIRSEPIIVS